MKASVDDTGTTITIALPRKPTTDVRSQLQDLTQAGELYQAAFENANDAMMVIDENARIVDANPAATDIYGVKSKELLGQPIRRFLPDEFDFDAEWQEFRESGNDRDIVTIEGKDGVDRPVEYTATTDIVPGQHLVVSRELEDRAL